MTIDMVCRYMRGLVNILSCLVSSCLVSSCLVLSCLVVSALFDKLDALIPMYLPYSTSLVPWFLLHRCLTWALVLVCLPYLTSLLALISIRQLPSIVFGSGVIFLLQELTRALSHYPFQYRPEVCIRICMTTACTCVCIKLARALSHDPFQHRPETCALVSTARPIACICM
jgi:hypothetical protein